MSTARDGHERFKNDACGEFGLNAKNPSESEEFGKARIRRLWL